MISKVEREEASLKLSWAKLFFFLSFSFAGGKQIVSSASKESYRHVLCTSIIFILFLPRSLCKLIQNPQNVNQESFIQILYFFSGE